MEKKRLSEKYYYFFVSFILSLSILTVFLSMLIAYANTQEQGFGEIRRPIDIYQRVDGNYVFVLGDSSTLIDVNSALYAVGLKKENS